MRTRCKVRILIATSAIKKFSRTVVTKRIVAPGKKTRYITRKIALS